MGESRVVDLAVCNTSQHKLKHSEPSEVASCSLTKPASGSSRRQGVLQYSHVNSMRSSSRSIMTDGPIAVITTPSKAGALLQAAG